MPKKLVTQAHANGRSVVVTPNLLPDIQKWLGEQGEVTWSSNKAFRKAAMSLRVRTPKGIRVAKYGDTIVKTGNRRGGIVPTFTVEKA